MERISLYNSSSNKLGFIRKLQSRSKQIFATFISADSPTSLSYRQNESTIFSPLSHPVRILIEVIAYPRTVNFQWYFNTSTEGWVPINASDDKYTINHIVMTSTLTINNLQISLLGAYRVNVSNGIKSIKQFSYLVLPAGTLFPCHTLPQFRLKLVTFFE